VSALPEPYPYWHQHKFGVERNPRIPAVRAGLPPTRWQPLSRCVRSPALRACTK